MSGENEGRLIATVGPDGVSGLGPSGHGVRVPAGEYTVAELDGVEEDTVFLYDPEQPDTLLAQVDRWDVKLRSEQS